MAIKEGMDMKEWAEIFQDAQYVLVGLGTEWEEAPVSAYEDLEQALKGKDYFIVTINTDGNIFQSSLLKDRITAPCGNRHWYQCEEACTKDIWEEGEIPDGKCPHCGKALVPNTVLAGSYIEEGYLPSWKAYTGWLSRTLNRSLFVMELGADFSFPNVIRWPFEKTAFFNRKSYFLRINERFPQLSAELSGRSSGEKENSLTWLHKWRKEKEHVSHNQ